MIGARTPLPGMAVVSITDGTHGVGVPLWQSEVIYVGFQFPLHGGEDLLVIWKPEFTLREENGADESGGGADQGEDETDGFSVDALLKRFGID